MRKLILAALLMVSAGCQAPSVQESQVSETAATMLTGLSARIAGNCNAPQAILRCSRATVDAATSSLVITNAMVLRGDGDETLSLQRLTLKVKAGTTNVLVVDAVASLADIKRVRSSKLTITDASGTATNLHLLGTILDNPTEIIGGRVSYNLAKSSLGLTMERDNLLYDGPFKSKVMEKLADIIPLRRIREVYPQVSLDLANSTVSVVP